MARLAEQAGRFDDMVVYMSRVSHMVKVGAELNSEERNLLSVGFKNAVGARRTALREIVKMMQTEKPEFLPCVEAHKSGVELELKGKCEEVLALLNSSDGGGLTATASASGDAEGFVFYGKMEGDYHRYLAEFLLQEPLHSTHAQKAYEAYYKSYEKASSALPATCAIRLGLALNFSVFYYEVYRKAPEACNLARASLDAAIQALEQLPSQGLSQEEMQRIHEDSRSILELLQQNLVLWNTESAAQFAGEGKPPEQDLACEDL